MFFFLQKAICTTEKNKQMLTKNEFIVKKWLKVLKMSTFTKMTSQYVHICPTY